MSRTYWFDMTFDLEFNRENIEILLQKGSQKNFLYYTFDMILKKKYQKFTDREAADYLLYLYEDEDADDQALYIKYQDTAINVRINKDDHKNIKLSGDFSYAWKKEFQNREFNDPDFARYIRLLLEVYKSFVIKELKTEILF